MKIHLKKVLLYILAATMFLAMLPMQYAVATAPGEPGITLSSASLYAGKYYYDSATVTGVDIRTILISFSGSVTTGDAIVLPASTPAGFTVSASSASNNYTKRINLNAGIAASDVQDYIRGVGFTLASQTQTVQITITTEDIAQDTFYNADTGHYYQFIPDTTSTWIQAYNAAKVMTYMGRSGYLATVMSLGEDTFVNALSNGKTGWLGGTILTNTGSSAGSLYYNGFNDNSVVSTGWYWACGPEKGTTFYNVNTLYPNNTNTTFTNQKDALNSTYYNWSRGIANEPNNNTAGSFYMNSDYETCLSTLKVSGRTGKHGTDFAWNDIRYNYAGSDSYHANGYVVEYGDQLFGDSGSAGNTFATASGTMEAVYTAAVNTNTDGAPAAAQGSVTLTQSGTTVYTLSGGATGIYTASAINGTYDVYINNEDTGKDIAINNGNGSVTVNYYTVSFSVSNAGTASGSTVSATAGGSSIASGAPVLAGKTVTLTATGAGASSYTYLWSGSGTSGETTASITIPSLSGTVNATCTVTGAPAAYEVNVYTATDSIFGPAPGVVELKQNDVTMYTAASNGTGRYTTNAVNGTYDVFINNEDTKKDIVVSGANAGVTVNYYTVKFTVIDAGAASGSTISALTQGPTPIASGAVVLAGKGVQITAVGAGASSYTYAWSGQGSNFEAGPVFQFLTIPGPLDVLCTVTGSNDGTYAAGVFTYIDEVAAEAPGSVELWQGGAMAYTLTAPGPTGLYVEMAVNGTYDVYINNEDTGKDIVINGNVASARVDYYTVSFSAADAGTASGSTISAADGGATVASGTAVLAGKAVAITATGAGAATYTYLWSGAGTSGETTADITIPSLSATVNALCTVTGTTTQQTYAVNIFTYTDSVPAAAPGVVELKQSGVTKYTAAGNGTGCYTTNAINGTYDIYINNEDTGKDITISGADADVYVDYYTVSFSAQDAGIAWGSSITASVGGTPLASGTAVLAGKAVRLTGHGAGGTLYVYAWSGPGINGEFGQTITIYPSGTVNALCRVTGTAETHLTSVYTYIDGALATVPGNVELWRGGAVVFTATNTAAGVYSMWAAYGTYDVYINNEDTGVDFAFSSPADSASVYYYMVSFAVANAGTASGSTITATAGGTPIASGAAVLPGKAVTITAQGAGADTYAYLWSGAGTSGETAAAIVIPTLNGTVNALCTITGTSSQVTYAADIYTAIDGVFAAAPGSVELKQGGVTVYTLGSSGTTGLYTVQAVDGTYDIYINNEDTGKNILIGGAAAGVQVDYYTVNFAVANAGTSSGSTVSATAGGTPISSGTTVLACKSVTITALGAGASAYTYLWSGSGTSGETAAAIAIPKLTGTVNALCCITGTANTYTPGTITEEVSDTTISAEGLFTQDARLIIIPLAEGESDREELESLLSGKQTAAAFEVHVEPANAFKAPLTLSFQLGEQYNGRTVYILHKLHSGKVEQFTVVVTSGEAVITVQELSPFLLTVDPPVTLTAQPQNVTVVTGQTATFTVTATGAEPLTYQWQKKTGANASWEDIPGAVNPKHTTSQANLSNSGFQYRVIVTDAYGRSVTSSAATLTVTKAPEPPATGDHSQPALYMALIILFMLSTFLLLRKRKAV